MWASILAFLTGLVEAIARLGQYFAQKQLIDAGKAEQQVQVQEQVDEHVEQAEAAVRTPDPVRTERLRSRFDRARKAQPPSE